MRSDSHRLPSVSCARRSEAQRRRKRKPETDNENEAATLLDDFVRRSEGR
jgi:hypothetical protein